ncbi:kinase-like protein [Dacryopinax primogenitus]|uniref:Kinase-like protein n=1 Tax=Dacryopinax primogenitus (strain DJM 731) TaxID=1858805 RepID=M5GDF2_DACPD|nr:kinase-like protein [Dacryopinax primogenitus]EJU02338.1 kinase-like protein [Dacryopinax primogenitus]
MTELPGKTLLEVIETLSPGEIVDIGMDLRTHLSEFRRIPNPYPTQVWGASGGEWLAPRFHYDWDMPVFEDVAAFHNWIQSVTGQYWPLVQPKVEKTFAKYHNTPTVFTHGDIAPHNILIEGGRISGLIDWETSGWMPHYWENICCVEPNRRGPEAFRKVLEIALADFGAGEGDGITQASETTFNHPPWETMSKEEKEWY